MTDLPDAVVNAAVEAFARKRNPKHSTLDHSETLAIRAALAAASGPWAKHLDTANAEIDHGSRGWEVTEAGWRCTECHQEVVGPIDVTTDDAHICSPTAARDAVLARNAELQRELGQWKDRMWVSVRERAVWSHEAGEHAGDIPFMHCPMCESKTLRAELDNLRDRVNALADKWQDSEFRRKQPVLAYVGLDVAARDLTADREAFDREVARKGAEVGRMNAAIVRGSDDEAEGTCTCGESVPTVTTPGPCYWAENAPGVQSQVHCPPADGVAR